MASKELLESGWSERVSNDPKHRPQVYDRPSMTVRKEWCRRPQEAHIAEGTKYRRLSVAEVARIQSFPAEWVDIDGVTESERIAVLGNAVPPIISKVIANVLKKEIEFENKTLLEICAGIGGLSCGFDYLTPIAKIELWDVAAKVLRTNKPWPAECVVEGLAQDYDYASVVGKVGLLCGGPPCQPWSQAGHQKGAEDPRDVMGFTPTAIAACEPEVFLFENVPGLFSASEHRAYVTDLLKRMGNPKDGLRYGVSTVILNAADYGVPQLRRRVFILGIKNKSNTFVHKILTKIQNATTHHDPTKPAVGKQPWVTLRQAFADIPVTEPWIKWKVTEETLRRLQLIDESEFIDDDVLSDEYNPIDTDSENILDIEEVNSTMQTSTKTVSDSSSPSIVSRLELLWPGKNEELAYNESKWKFTPKTDFICRNSLLYKESLSIGETHLGTVVIGDYLKSLDSLMTFVPSSVQCLYFDSPRLSVLETEADPGYAVSTWLSIVQQAAINSYKSLKYVGFFILHTDEEMAHYGRQVLDEVFGHSHHVTTFAWQKKYAPQNDKTKNNPTDVFDYIIVYSKCSLEDLPKVGILQKPDDIIDDGDWRGCYTAGHKGAKSGSEATKFHVNAPPYRWTLIDAHFPEGKYWFDEITGVLWFESVKGPGQYWAKVQCTDADGNTTQDRISFSVRSPEHYNDHFNLSDRIWWLLKDDNDIVTGGELKIEKDQSPIAIEGDQYSIVLRASGGKPYTMKSSAPGKNRYWEFALNTLIEAIATTNASFGSRGTALPSRKTFHDRDNAKVMMAVMNWLPWQDYGKSEDASRHVKSLLSSGLTSGEINLTAKPQKLLAHLITLFAPNEGDLVVSVGDINAVMASVSMKMHRTFIHITGSSSQDIEAWLNTGRGRLLAVMAGNDSGDVEKDDPLPFDYSVEQGSIDVLQVSNTIMKISRSSGAISIVLDENENIYDFYAGTVGSYNKGHDSHIYYRLNGSKVILLDSDEILDSGLLAYISSQYSKEKITIITERMELSENTPLPQNVSVLHAPFDLVRR